MICSIPRTLPAVSVDLLHFHYHFHCSDHFLDQNLLEMRNLSTFPLLSFHRMLRDLVKLADGTPLAGEGIYFPLSSLHFHLPILIFQLEVLPIGASPVQDWINITLEFTLPHVCLAAPTAHSPYGKCISQWDYEYLRSYVSISFKHITWDKLNLREKIATYKIIFFWSYPFGKTITKSFIFLF